MAEPPKRGSSYSPIAAARVAEVTLPGPALPTQETCDMVTPLGWPVEPAFCSGCGEPSRGGHLCGPCQVDFNADAADAYEVREGAGICIVTDVP